MHAPLLPLLLLLLAPLAPAAPLAGSDHIRPTCIRADHRFAIPTPDIHAAANAFLHACTQRQGPTFPDLGVSAKMTGQYSGCYNYAISGRAVLSVCLEEGMSVAGAEVFNRWTCAQAAAAWKELSNTARCPQEKGYAIFFSLWEVDLVGKLIVESLDVADGHRRVERPGS